MNIPTEADWRSEAWDLDTEWAYKNFQGKSYDEAVRLFEENALRYQEDVMFMPSRVFGFYLKAYMGYLTSDASRGDSDAASCFLSLMDYKSEHEPDEIRPLWPEIEPVLRRLVEHQDDYDADWLIYEDFRARVRPIVQRGFPISFDVERPEIIPEGVTWHDLRVASPRSLTFPVALQVMRNSGVDGLTLDSSKCDVLRVLGPPSAVGGGDHPQYGRIPDWIRYDGPDFSLRFTFEGEAPVEVMVLSPKHRPEA
ncbi:hypothetical protein [Planctomyces sp. SH-PL62]|uniref:hypothetical protein n=1 Tax=Planctomyces sp. SH-PL62 TaxID=1636152 RepID=UPI00078C2182|nr:hypothetical protein [Planctomyces sp. SH-PL62]AMV37103.1 hypothetical protein VT85_06705 [Planctomyces sp. SH-PL62]